MYKCKMCGGNLEPSKGQRVVVCEYCGSTQTIPTDLDEKKNNLFNRANKLRRECDFSKVQVIYENIVSEYPDEAEGYWGFCYANMELNM